MIVTGFPPEFMANFTSCQVAAKATNPYHIANELTTDNPFIYVCRNLRVPWPDFWKDFQYFGALPGQNVLYL